jgi:hypothetical protein
MNIQNQEVVTGDFIGLLEAHADKALEDSETNLMYADNVRRRARMVEKLLNGEIGTVKGVVCTWTDDIQPIAEALFGTDLNEHAIGEHIDYTPTVFPGVDARIRMLSSDEMLGPSLSLDITSEVT